MPLRRLRWHALALLLYTLLALLLTWPLLSHFTSHVIGDGIDDPSLAWNLWWIKQLLVEQVGWDIFHVGWMFHPIAINLGFYTLTPLNGLLSIPLQLAFGLITANNLLLLSSFVLSGYGAFLLARRLLDMLWAEERAISDVSPTPSSAHLLAIAFFAGLIYAFAAPKLFYASLGQFNIASSQWIPFCALFLLGMMTGQTRRTVLHNSLFASLFLVAQAWAELTYASFLLIFLASAFLWSIICWVADHRQRAAWFRWQVLGYGLIGLVFAIGISPFLWAMLPDLAAEGNFFASGGGFADIFSADLAGYLLPSRLHPLFGAWVAQLPFPNDKGQQIFLGFTAMLLALTGALRLVRSRTAQVRSLGWFWVGVTLLFWLLTLGPRLRWMGAELPLPGPFALVSQLPFFSGNRYPSRYSVMLLLCVAVLAAAGLWWLVNWLSRRAASNRRPTRWISGVVAGTVATLAGLLFLVEHLSIPLPLNDFRVPAIYDRLAALPGDFALLELPTGWRNGARVLGKSDVLIMMQQWYQTEHEKRRLGGNTSRNPSAKFQFFTEAPLIGDLIALMNADRDYLAPVVDAQIDALIERNRSLAPQVLEQLGVEAVMLHVEKSPPQLLRFVEQALPLELLEEWRGADWRGEPATMRLYRVQPSPESGSLRVQLASELGKLHLAEGWSALADEAAGVRYATRPALDLMVNIPAQGATLALEVFGPAQEVALALNGRSMGAWPIDPGSEPTIITATIPPGWADLPVDRLSLSFSGQPLSVAQLAASAQPPAGGWPVGQSGALLPAGSALLVRSAGEDVGDFAQIFVNGEDVSANQRGYNVAALGADGSLLETAHFDTFLSEAESNALADWLRQWPPGTLVAGAVADEASMHLNQAAVDALRSVGVASDLRGKFRWSHAFIGAAGATAGSALEATNLLQPASLWLGAPVDSAQVYGGVGELVVNSEK
jgi:hypothetical protein